jgi:hypothetical protein
LKTLAVEATEDDLDVYTTIVNFLPRPILNSCRAHVFCPNLLAEQKRTVADEFAD